MKTTKEVDVMSSLMLHDVDYHLAALHEALEEGRFTKIAGAIAGLGLALSIATGVSGEPTPAPATTKVTQTTSTDGSIATSSVIASSKKLRKQLDAFNAAHAAKASALKKLSKQRDAVSNKLEKVISKDPNSAQIKTLYAKVKKLDSQISTLLSK